MACPGQKFSFEKSHKNLKFKNWRTGFGQKNSLLSKPLQLQTIFETKPLHFFGQDMPGVDGVRTNFPKKFSLEGPKLLEEG